MSLLCSTAEAKWFNDLSQWVDSLKSTPEGNAKYQDIFRKSCMTIDENGAQVWDLTKGPVKNVYTYVFTRPADGILILYSKYGEDLGQYIYNPQNETCDALRTKRVKIKTKRFSVSKRSVPLRCFQGYPNSARIRQGLGLPYNPQKRNVRPDQNGTYKNPANPSVCKTTRILNCHF